MNLLNEKDTLQDLLTQEKEIIKLYGTFISEGSTNEIRKLMQENLLATAADQFKIFEDMKKRKYYNAKAAKSEDITEAKKMFAKIETELH